MILELLDRLEARGLRDAAAAGRGRAAHGHGQRRSRSARERLFEATRAHPDPWIRASVPFALAQKAENDGDVDGDARAPRVGARPPSARSATAGRSAMALLSWGSLRTLEGALDDAAATLGGGSPAPVRAQRGRRPADAAAAAGRRARAPGRHRRGPRAVRARSPQPRGERGAERGLARPAGPDRRAGRASPAPRGRCATSWWPRSTGSAATRPGRDHSRAVVLAALAALALVDGDEASASEHLEASYAAAAESRRPADPRLGRGGGGRRARRRGPAPRRGGGARRRRPPARRRGPHGGRHLAAHRGAARDARRRRRSPPPSPAGARWNTRPPWPGWTRRPKRAAVGPERQRHEHHQQPGHRHERPQHVRRRRGRRSAARARRRRAG